MQPSLIDFYTSVSPVTLTTGEKYYIDNLIIKDDTFWEECHNFIQWVFPNSIPSKFNPDAPLLKDRDMKCVTYGPWKKLYGRFLVFLGIYWGNDNFDTLFVFNEERFARWFNGEDHNCLRVTRVMSLLHSLDQYDMKDSLWAFLCKENVNRNHPCGFLNEAGSTMSFWYHMYVH